MMSKKIDFNKVLDEDEERYVTHRPWLLAQAAQMGVDVKFASASHDVTDEEPDDESDESDEDESDEDESDEESEDYSDGSVWTKATLQAEIDRRNEEYDEDDQIVSDGTKRQNLVDALLADDAASEEDDEDEE